MRCPHCQVMFTESWTRNEQIVDPDGYWHVQWAQCDNDACQRYTWQLVRQPYAAEDGTQEVPQIETFRPKGAVRPLAAEVPEPFRSDFQEAAVTLPDSAKASAALSRRCLQALIREKAGIKERTLSQEIDKLLASGQLPSWLAENVDAVRNVGNLAAHPEKDEHTGEIVVVEPGEAEWLLDVLEELFDFYFVQPAAGKRKRDALNAKLKALGKPEMK